MNHQPPAINRQPVRKAVIPAAGMGTRFLPATKSMPKEMLPIVDKPVLQFVIEEAVASGIDDILIITGRGKRAIENHFDFNPELEAFLASVGKRELIEQVRDIGDRAQIHYIRQKEQLGLGDAIRLGRDHVGDQPFAVLLGTEMPAILVEASCLSNQEEVELLTSADYREQIASALLGGIRAYARELDGVGKKEG